LDDVVLRRNSRPGSASEREGVIAPRKLSFVDACVYSHGVDGSC
jgi:hypothetical protein